jgi:calcineurin-like phosphoesterase family protein
VAHASDVGLQHSITQHHKCRCVACRVTEAELHLACDIGLALLVPLLEGVGLHSGYDGTDTSLAMGTTFLISDTHFGHTNICRFVRDDGSPLRPWSDINLMDDHLVERWNRVVSPQDKVYHLGDVAIPRRGLKRLKELNGRKILIKGNHDIFKLQDYLLYFDDIRGSHYMDGYILTHIPVHTENLNRYKANIHGHLHYRNICHQDGSLDGRYQNVCVEHVNYEPIPFDTVRDRLKAQGL